jgi:hypothetical protein
MLKRWDLDYSKTVVLYFIPVGQNRSSFCYLSSKTLPEHYYLSDFLLNDSFLIEPLKKKIAGTCVIRIIRVKFGTLIFYITWLI